jgi:hypothetical protein
MLALTFTELNLFHKKIALYYYETGTSFARIEQPSLLEALQVINPSVTLPNRKKLAGELLDHHFKRIKTGIETHFQEYRKTSYMTISSDGSEDINRQSVTTYNRICNGISSFIKLKHDGSNRHTAEYISTDIAEVINDQGEFGTVVGSIFDNTETNRAACKLLLAKFPNKFFQGIHNYF